MSLNLALTSAISGLSTAQAGLDVISNNIANVNTPGYTRKVLVPESVVLSNQGAGVTTGDIVNNVNQNLLSNLRQQNSTVGLLQTLATYYQQVQNTFGSTANQTSISNQINTLQQNFASLEAAPENASQQLATVQSAANAANTLADMSDTVQTLRQNADQDITTDVNQINSDLTTISQLNQQISQATAANQPVGDLTDKRDFALNDLSNLIDIRYFQNGNGSVTVYTSDGTTLVDNAAVQVTHVPLSQVSPSSSYAAGDFNGIFAGVVDITNSIQSGALKSLINMRDTVLPDVQSQLDQLGSSLQTQVNQVSNQGTAFPAMVNDITGTRSFMSSSTETLTFSGGVPNVILYDTNGNEIASSAVTDPNGIGFTNGGTVDDLASDMQTWIRAQNPQLANATVAVNSSGNFAINLGTDTAGISFRDEQSTIKGSAQEDTTVGLDLDGDGTVDQTFSGFSNFLGLNDIFTSTPNLAQWTSSELPQNYTLGIPSAATLQFSDTDNPTGIPGATVNVNPGDSLQTIADNINANSALSGIITASIVPDGNGQQLVITQNQGEQIAVTQQGGTNVIDTLGLNVSQNGIAQTLAVNPTLMSNSALLPSGQPQLNPLTGQYVLAPGDNSVVTQLANLMTSKISFQSAGSLSGTQASLSDYAANIIALSSTNAANNQTTLTTQQALQSSLSQQNSTDTGVNLDQEMSQLLIYQQAYAASAKVISTTQQLLQVLNSIIPSS